MALIDDVKNYLDITWTDVATDTKLAGIIQRGQSYLNRAAGAELDYDEEGQAKALLLDYCRYARSNALEDFQNNYLHELLSLQMTQEVQEYVAENSEPTV